jgi:multiple sugar transport system substrate-binding protein
MVEAGTGWAAVPIDGWIQGIWYRRDLFDEQGLAPPSTYEAILAAARAFHDPDQGTYGIVIGTDPEQIYTQQVFEHFALANGAQLFDAQHRLTLNSDAMVDTLRYYTELANYGPPGPTYSREARLEYLAGNAAMMLYSTYIMDDIAGLVEDVEVGVQNLAQNTAMMPLFQGPDADAAAGYGQIVVLGITRDADSEATIRWAQFLLSDGYMDIINMSPMGKMPMRPQFVEQWRQNQVLSYYSPEVVKEIAGGFEGINRWGIRSGGLDPLVSDIYGQKLIPVAVGNILEELVTPAEAAEWLQSQAQALLEAAQTP